MDPKQCNTEKNFSWSKNPAFEQYKDSSGRIRDELEVESFLLEVEDADLTELGLADKWKFPKLKEVFVKKLQLLAEKYDLRGTASSASGSAASRGGAKSDDAKTNDAKGGGAKGIVAPRAVVRRAVQVLRLRCKLVTKRNAGRSRLQRFRARLLRPQELTVGHRRK